jgi:hypothetical protein
MPRTKMVPVATRRRPSRADLQEAAETLRRVLEAVESGELTASTPKAKALVRRLEGTLAGWEEALGTRPDPEDHGP